MEGNKEGYEENGWGRGEKVSLPDTGTLHAAVNILGGGELNGLDNAMVIQHGREHVVRRHNHASWRHMIPISS